MKKIIVMLLMLSLPMIAFAEIPEMKPSDVKPLNFSTEDEKEFNKKYADECAGYWIIDQDGCSCSWYCGNGGPRKIRASSYLQKQGNVSYEPENLHDFTYNSVWAEGVEGNGEGEYIIYEFQPGPRITDIIIANGHVKSDGAWENNGRIKKLKVYLNDEPFAVLLLEDSRTEQSFYFEPFGSYYRDENAKNWTMKFEILEIYPGAKYNDTVISEIYFSGIDVH